MERTSKRRKVEMHHSEAATHRSMPPTIDIVKGTAKHHPDEDHWRSAACANEAAKNGRDSVINKKLAGRLGGTLQLSVHIADNPQKNKTWKTLTEPYVSTSEIWDDLGEYSTSENEVLLSRVEMLLQSRHLICSNLTDALAVITSIGALANPTSSPWRVPFIRTFAFVDSKNGTQPFHIKIYVYFTRLLFELIADPAIKVMMDALTPPGAVVPPAELPSYPPTFKTANPPDRFTRSGLLKSCEHAGYRDLIEPQPDALVPSLKLFHFQRQSVQWMLDQEKSVGGLNSYFWQQHDWADSGSFYYFPLAGELRLFTPPRITGGLLAEEMGLGKTIEMLSLILLNPVLPQDVARATQASEQIMYAVAPDRPRPKSAQQVTMTGSRATLVVVPITLLGQWLSEIDRNTKPGRLVVRVYFGPKASGKEKKPAGAAAAAAAAAAVAAAASAADDDNDLPDEGDENAMEFSNAWTSYSSLLKNLLPTNTIEEIADSDIVLCTYSVLQTEFTSRSSVYKRRAVHRLSRIAWHRVVLDECQEIKTPTSSLAKLCRELSATHRWMMSGTPLPSKLDDLHGELQFLRVWPFSLANDGFWENKIKRPYESKQPVVLPLLDRLLKVCLMRHSKSQQTLDGNSLMDLPPATTEVISLAYESPHERFVYQFLEAQMAESVRVMLQAHNTRNEFNFLNQRQKTEHVMARIKQCVNALLRLSSHWNNVPLQDLDRLQRSTTTVLRVLQPQGNNLQPGTALESLIPIVNVRELMARLTDASASRTRGMNRDVGRSWAVQLESELVARREYEEMTLSALRDLVVSRGMADPHKPRKQVYITMLIWHDRKEKDSKAGSSNGYEIHSAGFETLQKLLSGDTATCPICMGDVERPVVTICVHVYCRACILLQLSTAANHQNQATRCSICRRAMDVTQLMELELPKPGDEVDTDTLQDVLAPACPAENNEASSSASSSSASSSTNISANQKLSLSRRMPLNAESFRLTPAATMTLAQSIPLPRHVPVERNFVYPSLDPTLLAHYNAACLQRGLKVSALIQDIRATLIRDPEAKFIVFSQYLPTIKYTAEILQQEGLTNVRVVGSADRDQRQSAVIRFNTDPQCRVFLSTIGVGAVGLTLTAANTIYFLEPVPSAADEAQAANRAHRIGQTRPVRSIIFYVRDTVEERLLHLRMKNQTQADLLAASDDDEDEDEQSGLSGSADAHFSKDDLEALIGLRAS